jgi:transcriptional regulator with XRE-family HTH domain
MAVDRASRTVQEWEERVGEQIHAARAAAGLDQASLAELAGLSVGAIKNLEGGKGSSLKTIIRVLRALDRTDWLEALAPPITISPLHMLASKRANATRRRRVVASPRSRSHPVIDSG